MRRTLVLALAAYLLIPTGMPAQEIRSGAELCDDGECSLSPDREREIRTSADSLRSSLDCPTDVDWPRLPAEGRTVFRTPEPKRTDVTVPQYAYYYHSGWGPGDDATCLPVIVVQAHGSTLGWMAVLDPPPAAGAAFVHFFDLLGTEPPDAAERSAESVQARTPDVPPEVTYVVTGGYWTAGEMGGQYRLVVWNEGSERVHSNHRLQWIVVPPDDTAPTVLASIPITEFGAPWLSRPSFESRDGAPVFVIQQTGFGDPSRERVVEVHPGEPGEYRLKLTSERRDL